MKTKQIFNLLWVALFCTLFILVFEIIFSIDAVNIWIGSLIENSSNYVISLVIVWILNFLQVWLIPVPAYLILLASSHTGLISAGFLNFQINDLTFFLVTMSAYVCGFCLAYLIGRNWGSKAVKWAAGSENDYQKWSNLITTKGKWWYALTVLFPFFPDDILCLLAGSVKLNFKFFFIVNLVCRSIGLICTIELIKFMGTWNSGGFPITILFWGLILLAIIIMLIVYKIKLKKEGSE